MKTDPFEVITLVLIPITIVMFCIGLQQVYLFVKNCEETQLIQCYELRVRQTQAPFKLENLK